MRAGILPAVRRHSCRPFLFVLSKQTQDGLEFLSVLSRHFEKFNAGSGRRGALHNAQLISNCALQVYHAHAIAGPSNIDFISGTELALRRQETSAAAKSSDLIVKLTLWSPTPIGKEINAQPRVPSILD